MCLNLTNSGIFLETNPSFCYTFEHLELRRKVIEVPIDHLFSSNFNFTLAVSGLAESKEVAQSRVSVAAGMYAGITVFCLTLTWGICVIFGSKSFPAENSPSQDSEAPTSGPMLIREKLSFLTSQ